MHIVFIVGSYYPYYSAVGKCIGNVAEEMADNHKVTIICQKTFIEEKDDENVNNQRIIRVITKEKRIREKFEKKIEKERGIRKKVSKILFNIYKISRATKTILSKVSIKENVVNLYVHALNKIGKIDVIIPASLPFESVLAAIKYKTACNEVKIIPYLFDQFVDNKALHRNILNKRLKRKKHLYLEKRILDNSKAILILNQLKEHFYKEFPDYTHIFNIVEHPLVKRHTTNIVNNKALVIVYTGSFYKKIRNPEYFLKVVEKALNYLVNAKLNIYSFGDCENIVKKYTSKNNRMFNYGRVSTEKAYQAISKANILIAIGNIDNSQLPSKIFEYISFGKPIVYFYSNDNDYNLEVLNKYSLSLCLKQEFDKLNENINLFNKFCRRHANSGINFNTVEKIYYNATPKYIVDCIMNVLKM